MAAITQVGTAVKIGYGSFAYTGYVAQALTRESTGEIKTLKNPDNATFCKLIEDLGFRLVLKLYILDSVGGAGVALVPPTKGSTITLTPPEGTPVNCMCESASVDHQAEENMLNLTVIKEVSMTYA